MEMNYKVIKSSVLFLELVFVLCTPGTVPARKMELSYTSQLQQPEHLPFPFWLGCESHTLKVKPLNRTLQETIN